MRDQNLWVTVALLVRGKKLDLGKHVVQCFRMAMWKAIGGRQVLVAAKGEQDVRKDVPLVWIEEHAVVGRVEATILDGGSDTAAADE